MLVLSKEYECGVVEWAAGKLIGLMNVARDITCRHSISESLEKREEGRKEGRKGASEEHDGTDANPSLCSLNGAIFIHQFITIVCRLCRDPSYNRVR